MSNSIKSPRKLNVRFLTMLALFVALIVLLGMTPLGMIPLPLIKASILATPVVIGTLILGLKGGLVLGLAFGLVSTWTAFTNPSGLVMPLTEASPLAVVLMCVLPRLCIPVTTWFVHRFLEKHEQNPSMSYLTSALCGAVVNALVMLMGSDWFVKLGMDAAFARTLAVLLGMAMNVLVGYLMFRLMTMKGKAAAVASVCGSMTNTVLYLGMMLALYVAFGINSAAVLGVIGGTALMAGSAEAVLAAIICPPILTALRRLK